jgi:hypothetical protein
MEVLYVKVFLNFICQLKTPRVMKATKLTGLGTDLLAIPSQNCTTFEEVVKKVIFLAPTILQPVRFVVSSGTMLGIYQGAREWYVQAVATAFKCLLKRV